MDFSDTVTIDGTDLIPPDREFIILWQWGCKEAGLNYCLEGDPDLWIDEQDLPTTSIIRSKVLTLEGILFGNPYIESAME